MILNIGTGVALLSIAFSSSRCAALIERRILQNTTSSIKLHHCTLNEIKTEVFKFSDVLACGSITNTLRGSETILKPRLFNKIH